MTSSEARACDRAIKMCALVLLLFLAAFAAAAHGDYQNDREFMQWLSTYHYGESDPGKMYSSWKKNAEFIKQHNAGGHSYTLSLNQFAHLTPKELLKEKIHPMVVEAEPEMTQPTLATLPPSVDWRTKGVVPPVQNEGQCGSSVSFALVGAVDAFHAIQTKQLVLGSEEEYRDCCIMPPCSCGGEIVSGDGYNCIVEIGGLAGEDSYPNPTDCKCMNDSVPPAIKIDGGRAVSPSRNETALEAAVAMQPVFAVIDASHNSFQFYLSGIYNEPSCSQTNLDHAVLIVGYGSEGKGEDYWIVQNSWGTSWGMDGYILMSRNKNNQCGIATAASYPY